MPRVKVLCGGALALLLSMSCASAWLRFYAPDDELVSRSDAIVIGHVENGFTKFEPPRGSATEPHWWEYRTTLVVTQTLRGKIQVGPTPLLIHYGICPVVLKEKPSIEDTMNPIAADQNTAADTPVGIKDVCDWGGALSDNIRQDHIWFLSTTQHGSPGPGNEDVSAPGIWSPQDVQALDRRPYYDAVMSGNPEALTSFTVGDTYQARQARTAQSRMNVTRITKIPDPSARCDQLLAIYIKEGPLSSTAELAMDGIMACGPLGAAKLIPVFADPANHTLDRRSILNAWRGRTWQGLDRGAPFPGAGAVIVKWLQDEDAWWSTQTTADMVFGSKDGQRGGDPYNDPRAVSFRNIFCSIEAIGNYRTPETKAIVERIREHWKAASPFDSNNDPIKCCDDTLAALK